MNFEDRKILGLCSLARLTRGWIFVSGVILAASASVAASANDARAREVFSAIEAREAKMGFKTLAPGADSVTSVSPDKFSVSVTVDAAGAAAIDMITCYYDRSSYYCTASLTFGP